MAKFRELIIEFSIDMGRDEEWDDNIVTELEQKIKHMLHAKSVDAVHVEASEP